MIDTGGEIALIMAAFTTAAPRDRDPPLDVTLGDVLSYLHVDLPGIVRDGTTMEPIRHLLEVDTNEQVIDLKARLLFRCQYVCFFYA